MDRAKKAAIWTEVGYDLFAAEGLDGIQIERLARILQLNKSGFYHYFGDLDAFCQELLTLHNTKANLYFSEIQNVKSIDPEYLCLLVKYKTPLMFQLQLIRSPHNSLFYNAAKKLDGRTDVLLRDLWSDYLGLTEHPDLAVSYFNIVRDMFYARLSFQNCNYSFLHSLITEAKTVMRQIVGNKQIETDKSVF
jgi:AcrR family transcriptional regulator